MKKALLRTFIAIFIAASVFCICATSKPDTFSKTFAAGWHLISAPCDVGGMGPLEFFAPVTNDVVFMESGQMKYLGEMTSLATGRGYWAFFDGEKNVSVDCPVYASQTATFSLEKGWNIIGVPFPAAHWSESLIDGVAVGVSPKIASGPFVYDEGSKSYGVGSIMNMWEGYAVKANVSGSLQVSIMSSNSSPIANAGDDFKWFVGSSYKYVGGTGSGLDRNSIYERHDIAANLDGRNSSDPDGDALTYSWRQTAGPVVEIANPSASATTFIPKDETAYQFELTVSDGLLSATDTVTITTKKLTGKLVMGNTNGTTDDIYTLSLEDDTGTGFKRITDHYSGEERMPRWSTDGVKILYSGHQTGTDDNEIYLMNEDGTGKIQITNNTAAEYSGDISGDGRVVFCSDKDGAGDLYDVDMTGGDERRLTNLNRDCAIPKYSPDSSMIVFLENYGGDNDEIYVVKSDGSNPLRLTNDSYVQGSVNWTPDGKIMFMEKETIVGVENIYQINADGTGKTLMPTPSAFEDFASAIMTNDSEFIYFHDYRNHLIVMYADGSSYVDLGFGGITGQFDYHPGP